MNQPAAISVTVPATTANLGCAFDCAAIALTRYLRVTATAAPAEAGFTASYRGPGAELIPLDGRNLIIQAIRQYAARAKRDLPGVRLEIDNEIPLGVGLGSSAAAIVAGIVLGAQLCQAQLDASGILQLALEIESHPDNLAAAVHGGMVVSAVACGPDPGPRDVLIFKAEVSQSLDFVCVVPEVALPTEQARAVLPLHYSRGDVVANLQRTALLAAAFFSGKNLSPELFRDRLHQPYRARLVPGIAPCLEYRHPGLAGVFLSGAGSAVMAIARHSAREIAAALTGEFERAGTGATALLLKADNRGMQVR